MFESLAQLLLLIARFDQAEGPVIQNMVKEKLKILYPESYSSVPDTELFAADVHQQPTADDLFTVPFESSTEATQEDQFLPESSTTTHRHMSTKQALTIAGVVIVGLGMAYFVLVPSVPIEPEEEVPPVDEQVQTAVVRPQPEPSVTESAEAAVMMPIPATAQLSGPESSLSIGQAERMFASRNFVEAYRIYFELHAELAQDKKNAIRSFLLYRMALCQKAQGQTERANQLLRVVSQSQVPLIRALSRYYLSLSSLRDARYFDAAKRARQALGLIDVVKKERAWGPAFERHCYFLEARALTQWVLALLDKDHMLPELLFEVPALEDPFLNRSSDELLTLLNSGQALYDGAVLAPQISLVDENAAIPLWQVVCQGASVEEVMVRFLARAELMDIDWNYDVDTGVDAIDEAVKKRPVYLFLSGATTSQALSAIAGVVGLSAQPDDQRTVRVIRSIDNLTLAQQKERLLKDAHAVWTQFLFRSEESDYLARARFARGLINSQTDNISEALDDYKQIVNLYTRHVLAPYGLLNSSSVKSDLRNFVGATEDLTLLVEQYPEFERSGNALVYLADANLNAGKLADAVRLYVQVFNYDYSPETNVSAAFGAGKASYLNKAYADAIRWLEKYLSIAIKGDDSHISRALLYLGKSYRGIESYDKALDRLDRSLTGDLPQDAYFDAMVSYLDTQIQLENYIPALDMISSGHPWQFSITNMNRIRLLEAHIHRKMGLSTRAIVILKEGLSDLAEPNERVDVYREMAQCYELDAELSLARQFYIEAWNLLEPGPVAYDVRIKVAEITLSMGDVKKAIEMCNTLTAISLSRPQQRQVNHMLSKAYLQENDLTKAAAIMLQQNLSADPNATGPNTNSQTGV